MQGVYKITNNINNKVYIGCSKDIEKRLENHKLYYKYVNIEQFNKKYLYKAMRKYGIENFTFEILEETPNYFEREKYWIEYYKSNDSMKGYNLTAGGEGMLNGPSVKGENNPNSKLKEEDIFFIRQCALQDLSCSNIYNNFYNDKISLRQFQRIWRGEGNSWNHILPEVRDHITSPEYIKKIKTNASLSRQVVKDNNKRKEIFKQYLDNGLSRMEAYNKYCEEYEKDYSLNAFTHLWYNIKPKSKNKTIICKIDIKTNEILAEYSSFAEAARENNCDSSSISKVCKGKKQTCGGFKWIQQEKID